MGGGSGGSQGSGKVSYAPYLEDAHQKMIGDTLTATLDSDLYAALNIALAATPYANEVAFNPDVAIQSMIDAVDTFEQAVATLISDQDTQADVNSYAAILDYQINTETLPKFDALARDMGIIQSSSFAIGRAIIASNRDRDVAKYASSLKTSQKERYVAAQAQVAHYAIETQRMRIASKVDENLQNVEFETLDATWEVDTLVKGGQLLGILGGGAALPNKPSRLQSALAGGLSGAAAGALIGGPSGAAIGGAVGVASAFL